VLQPDFGFPVRGNPLTDWGIIVGGLLFWQAVRWRRSRIPPVRRLACGWQDTLYWRWPPSVIAFISRHLRLTSVQACSPLGSFDSSAVIRDLGYLNMLVNVLPLAVQAFSSVAKARHDPVWQGLTVRAIHTVLAIAAGCAAS
jgi:hypothetical protein